MRTKRINEEVLYSGDRIVKIGFKDVELPNESESAYAPMKTSTLNFTKCLSSIPTIPT